LPHPTRSTRAVILILRRDPRRSACNAAACSTLRSLGNFRFRGIGRRKGRLPAAAFSIIRMRAEILKGGSWPKSSTEN
jgi:hypothetical protein